MVVVIISPNPAHEQVTIQLKEGTNEIRNVGLFNLSGQLVLDETVSNNNTITLNIKSIPVGVYYLRIDLGDDVISQKIVKQ